MEGHESRDDEGVNDMSSLTVTIRRYNQMPYDAIVATARTTDPTEAIRRVAARKLGYRSIGLIEHFRGGGTYHVQFVTAQGSYGTSLSDKYIVNVEA